MSIHPSLASSDKDKKQRSVLKRTERIKAMISKKQWKEGDDIYGLPKIKTVRIKIKKEKAEKTETAAASPAQAAGSTAAPAAGATAAKSSASGPKATEKK